MKLDEDFLGNLPQFEADDDLEARLFADALGEMPIVSHSKPLNLWAGLAVAASLAFGFWVGFGELIPLGDMVNNWGGGDMNFEEIALSDYDDLWADLGL